MTQTIFILAGGNDKKSPDYGPQLSQQIAAYTTQPKILSCFFSSEEEGWAEKAVEWQDWFADNFTQPFTYDYARSDSLLAQIDAADIIYFHGGKTPLLCEKLPATQELKKHLRGKVVVGSSAGANMLSTYYWSSTRGGLCEGLAIVDANVMVHYRAADASGYKRTPEVWDQEEAEFQRRLGDGIITQLPEGQFVVFEERD